MGPPKSKKLIFSKNPNSVICLNMGGGQGSGPSHPDGVGPLGLIRRTPFLLWPPVKKEVKILKKIVCGTNDGACSFYLSMNETLKKLGGKQVTGDDAFYTFHNKKGKVIRLVRLHVDDLYVAGDEEFRQNVNEPLKKRYVFGKEET